MPLDRNAEKQEVPVDPKTGKPYINTLAAVAISPAQARRNRLRVAGGGCDSTVRPAE